MKKLHTEKRTFLETLKGRSVLGDILLSYIGMNIGNVKMFKYQPTKTKLGYAFTFYEL